MSSLSVEQQARAVRAYVKQELRLDENVASVLNDVNFVARLDMNFITIFGIFVELYGYRNDCLDQLAELVKVCAGSWQQRPEEFKILDKERELNKDWYNGNEMLGGVSINPAFSTVCEEKIDQSSGVLCRSIRQRPRRTQAEDTLLQRARSDILTSDASFQSTQAFLGRRLCRHQLPRS